MEKQKRPNRHITENEKDMKKLSGRLLKLFKDHGYDVEKDCHAIRDIITAMENEGFILSNPYKTIRSHVFNDVSDIDITWLHNYCKFFKCSADYILGYIDQPTHETTDVYSKTGLSFSSAKKLLKADKDTQILFDRLIAGGYLKDIVSAMNTYYDIGSSVQIRGEMLTDKKTISILEKEVEGIKLKPLLDSAKRSIHKLAYDEEVSKHFLNSRLDLYNDKVKAIHKDNPMALKAWEDQFPDFKKDMLDTLDKLQPGK